MRDNWESFHGRVALRFLTALGGFWKLQITTEKAQDHKINFVFTGIVKTSQEECQRL